MKEISRSRMRASMYSRCIYTIAMVMLLAVALPHCGVEGAGVERRHRRRRVMRARQSRERRMLRARQVRHLELEEPAHDEEAPAKVSSEEATTTMSHFVPGRVIIAGNKRCVNRCAASKGCRSYTSAAPERRDQCVLSCHQECSVCPLSAVTRDCGRACVSQCESTDQNGPLARQACHHACLEKCPCEDLGPQLFDLIDKIPDFVVEVESLGASGDTGGAGGAGSGNGLSAAAGGMARVPIGISENAKSGLLRAAMKDPSAKAALLAGIQSEGAESAGAEALLKAQENADTHTKMVAEIAQAKLEGDQQKAAKLERESQEMKDAADEQLQDGQLAIDAAETVGKLSEDAMRGAEEVSKLEDAAAASVMAGDASGGKDLADQAQAIVSAGEEKACKAAKKARAELETKVETLDELAAGLYNENERAAKGPSPNAAKKASDEYEKAAAKAYAAGQALSAMKAKVVEACGDGSPDEVKQSKNAKSRAYELKAEAASLRERAKKEVERGGDQSAVNRTIEEANELDSKALETELQSSVLALEAQDELRNQSHEHTFAKVQAFQKQAVQSSKDNNHELAKMIQRKVSELNESLSGQKFDNAAAVEDMAKQYHKEALDAIKVARRARQNAPGSAEARSLAKVAEAKSTQAKKSLEAARQSVAESAEENPEDSEEIQAEDEIRKKIDEAAALGDSEAVEKYEKLLEQFTNATETADNDAEGATGTGGDSETGTEQSKSQSAEDSESKYRIMYAKILRGENATADEVEATINEVEEPGVTGAAGDAEESQIDTVDEATGMGGDTNLTNTSEGNYTGVGSENAKRNDDYSRVVERKDFARLHRIETQTQYEDFLGNEAEEAREGPTGGDGLAIGSNTSDVGDSAKFASPYAYLVDASS